MGMADGFQSDSAAQFAGKKAIAGFLSGKRDKPSLATQCSQGDALPKCSCAWVAFGDAVRKSKPPNPHPNQHRIDNHQIDRTRHRTWKRDDLCVPRLNLQSYSSVRKFENLNHLISFVPCEFGMGRMPMPAR